MHRRRLRPRLVLLVAIGLLWTACATTGGGGKGGKKPDALAGLVLNPEGRPVAFVKVMVVPQAPASEASRSGKLVEALPAGSRGLAVTTEGGRWLVDHLSDELGADLGLPRGFYYEVTVYKPGFHVWKDSVLYEKGTLDVDVTLYPDTIDVEDIGHMVDTAIGDTNTGTGVLRQGE